MYFSDFYVHGIYNINFQLFMYIFFFFNFFLDKLMRVFNQGSVDTYVEEREREYTKKKNEIETMANGSKKLSLNTSSFSVLDFDFIKLFKNYLILLFVNSFKTFSRYFKTLLFEFE